MSQLTDAQLIQDAQMAEAMRRNYPRHLRLGTDDSDFNYHGVKYVPKAVSTDRADGDEVLFVQDPDDHFRRPFWYNTCTGRYYPYEAAWTRFSSWVAGQLELVSSRR